MRAAWMILCLLMPALFAGCADDAADPDTAPVDAGPTPEQIEAEKELAKPEQ